LGAHRSTAAVHYPKSAKTNKPFQGEDMSRHTKIVATLGPASSSPEVLEKLVAAGIDVVRMNFSHGTADDHKARAEGIRAAAANLGRTVGILGDLQGPKIRAGKFEGN